MRGADLSSGVNRARWGGIKLAGGGGRKSRDGGGDQDGAAASTEGARAPDDADESFRK
jgi:hypothetical protein